MARVLPWILAAGLAVVVAIGLGQAGGRTRELEPLPLADAQRSLAGSPAPLAGLHAQAGELVGGGKDAFQRRVRELRGTPIVVNKWAAWCGPCRLEFPLFQHAAARHGRTVAFLGVDAKDSEPDARRFLKDFPVAYPTYSDPGLDISAALKAPAAWPTTIFLDRSGRIAYLHPGQYLSLSALDRDIARYLR